MSAEETNPIRGILFKLVSVAFFLMMQTCIKAAGADIPAGQITFFRSAFALIPIIIYLAWMRNLFGAFYTSNFTGHLKRGFLGILSMACGFYGLVHLPLPEAIALGYASPLLAVVFAALLLKETVRVYRWSAVLVGMVGVLIILWPKMTMLQQGGVQSEEAIGALALMVCGVCGGIAQIFLTESYRHADVSTVAPFEYSSILFGIVVSYILFGDIPTSSMLAGTAIVVSAGIFIIFREHQLGLARKAARRASPPQG